MLKSNKQKDTDQAQHTAAPDRCLSVCSGLFVQILKVKTVHIQITCKQLNTPSNQAMNVKNKRYGTMIHDQNVGRNYPIVD